MSLQVAALRGGVHRSGLTAVTAVVIALICSSCLLMTPPNDPGPLRFRDEVFTTVSTTPNLVYASALNQNGTTATLYADLYEPTGDIAALRPMVIWVHGGSFKSGTRTSPEIVDEANTFARKGYVNASISYRLSATGCTVMNGACVQSIIDATADAQAAVRYFRANAATYRVDPNRIAIAGTSAGAIAAMNVGFRYEVAGNDSTPGVSSAVQAAVSLSGAKLGGTCEIDDAPALLFHGTSDGLVPYQWATSTVDCAKEAYVRVVLVTWQGDGHVPYVQHRTEILDQTTTFLFNAMNVRPLIP